MINPQQVFEYEFEDMHLFFSVQRAQEVCDLHGLVAYPIPDEGLRAICKVNEITDPEQLEKANPNEPGISVLLQHPKAPTNPFAVLIDGTHRAHRALQHGWEFKSYLIPPEFMEEILLREDEIVLWKSQQ